MYYVKFTCAPCVGCSANSKGRYSPDVAQPCRARRIIVDMTRVKKKCRDSRDVAQAQTQAPLATLPDPAVSPSPTSYSLFDIIGGIHT